MHIHGAIHNIESLQLNNSVIQKTKKFCDMLSIENYRDVTIDILNLFKK
jgi:hypothetical protein